MLKRKIIQKRVIALVLAIVLLAAIPILTASAVGGFEKAKICSKCEAQIRHELLPLGLRCHFVREYCDCSAIYFYSHEGRNVNGYCSTCGNIWM